MAKNPLKKFMEENPYRGVFEWHPLNLVLKRPKCGSESNTKPKREDKREPI